MDVIIVGFEYLCQRSLKVVRVSKTFELDILAICLVNILWTAESQMLDDRSSVCSSYHSKYSVTQG